MNKNAIQKYAIWARNELRNQITQRAFQYGITPKERPEKGLASVNGIMLTPIEQKQRDQLIEEVWRKGFDQVIEELAYTWFNRLIAIRFMEVNDYLPEGVRVLSNSKNEFKPEILTSALNLDEAHFKKDLILKLIDEGKQEELYRYLLLAECNALNEILPVMFERMDGYAELMLPANLLKPDSVIGKLISDIDEVDWGVTGSEDEEGGQVQIIGWLYQYYNSELKDETFADLKKKNKKISKERIPAATQLFTPDWIVRYMVENSLGRLWLEGHPNEDLKKNWKYYLEEAEQEPEVEAQLKEIRKEYAALKPEDLSTADLAMGSGHILVYAFDILMQIYRSEGYRDRDAVRSILENNLYGLDIDDRATQLAYFAIMMKAREYDRRIFDRGIQPNVFAIQESNGISKDTIDFVAHGDMNLKRDLNILVTEMKDAKEYGSLINSSRLDFNRIEQSLENIKDSFNPYAVEAKEKLLPLVGPAKILSTKVWVCCMNPPYLGNNGMDEALSFKVKTEFPNSKYDLFACFIECGFNITKTNGYLSLITQHAWMFLSSYMKLREATLYKPIINMAHLGPRAFEDISGEVVQTTAYISLNTCFKEYYGQYVRLIDERDSLSKKNEFFNSDKRYYLSQKNLNAIPGKPLVYWLTENEIESYQKGKLVLEIADPRLGMATANNDKFVRYWFEVDYNKLGLGYKSREQARESKKKWFPYNSGGSFRKWFGNNEYVVNWENDGTEIRNYSKGNNGKINSHNYNLDYIFQESLTWSALSSSNFGIRYSEPGALFDNAGSSLFCDNHENLLYILGFLSSDIALKLLFASNPTLNFQPGNIGKLPIIFDENRKTDVIEIVSECIEIAKKDWDTQEVSYGFSETPLLKHHYTLIKDAFNEWKKQSQANFKRISNLENYNNNIFSDIYGSEIADNFSIPTLSEVELSKAVRSLISYAVGTLFGRYSPEEKGIIYAGGDWDSSKYKIIQPDQDNIIPIGEDEYFDDDLTARFVDWIKTIYGAETLEENLLFIAEGLGGNGSSREIIRKYFLNDFFLDHCKTYKKHPIYWLFDSGKKNGFKCLVYVHRYKPDTIARIRTDYVHEQQERYRSQIKHIENAIDGAPKSEQVKMRKQLKDLQGKLDEVTKYEEKIHHLADQMIKIDLDDGVKHNYAIFQDVLAKIK